MGIIWRGIMHDLSKFLPGEFIPYARYFYGDKNDISRGRDSTGYYQAGDTISDDFNFAWLLHQKRNRHHWQWWVLPMDDGTVKIFDMPIKYRKEMICDWVGAGKAQGKFSPKNDKYRETRAWYHSAKYKMLLGHDTQEWIEKEIEYENSDSQL
jgi:hypothetical protein